MNLRRDPIAGEVCQFCREREQKTIPAYAVVAGSPMCKLCFHGTPVQGTLAKIIKGKAMPGRVSEKYAKVYEQIDELIQGSREFVKVTVDWKTMRFMRCNILSKGRNKGVSLTSHYVNGVLLVSRKLEGLELGPIRDGDNTSPLNGEQPSSNSELPL